MSPRHNRTWSRDTQQSREERPRPKNSFQQQEPYIGSVGSSQEDRHRQQQQRQTGTNI